MDYSKLSDFEINKRVALTLGFILYKNGESHRANHVAIQEGRCGAFTMDYCNNPADAWPIIVANQISILYEEAIGKWNAGKAYRVDGVEWQITDDVMDKNPLRAAIIVFLMMQDH